MSMENLRLPTWKCWDFQAAGKESEWTGGTDPSPDGKASLQGLASLLKNVWYTNKIKVCPILEAKPMLLKRDRTALQSVVPSLFNQHAEDRQQWGQFPALPRHQVLSWSEVRILLNELNRVHLHWPSLLLGFWSDLDLPGYFTEVTSLSKR